jgi:NAD(P)-dependent dehydrogenase (short-subunit alcohol dehydrogenase family)
MSKHRIALVTGASRGIGLAISEKLINDGYRVAMGFNNTKIKNKRFLKDENIFPVKIDISARNSIDIAIRSIEEYFNGTIDVLINNGAISQEKPFEKITDVDWDTMLTTNLKGPFMLTQGVLKGMLKNHYGRIINIVSIGGQWGGVNQVHYAASKAALINFTQSISKIFSKNGIISNAVSPGLVVTDMTKCELGSDAGKNKASEIPIGRVGNVNEIAAIVSFLCSDDASYIVGQTINANGGMYFG